MAKIPLRDEQQKREGNLIRPIVEGHNSVYFHALTQDFHQSYYREWGKQLTRICEEENISYYYIETGKMDIGVYPDEVFEKWFKANINSISSARKRGEEL